MAAIVAGLAVIVALGGCTAALPTYPGMSDDAALGLIAERLESVRAVSAVADISLTGPDGRRVRLDGAFIAMPPDRARLRAWKFGTPVLDLTVLPQGVWVYSPDTPGRAGGHDLSRIPAASIAPALELLSAAYFRRARPLAGASTGRTIVVVGPALGSEEVRCEIDRATLTPRRFLVASGHGELLLDKYAKVGAIVWPHVIHFRGEEGEILVRLDELELNIELPGEAFTPPGRARLLP